MRQFGGDFQTIYCIFLPFSSFLERKQFSFQNDRETLQRIQMGDIDFDFELWQNISREAKHFVANLLVYKPEERMSVRQALSHPWLQILKQPGIEISEQYQISTERLRTYYGTLKYVSCFGIFSRKQSFLKEFLNFRIFFT